MSEAKPTLEELRQVWGEGLCHGLQVEHDPLMIPSCALRAALDIADALAAEVDGWQCVDRNFEQLELDYTTVMRDNAELRAKLAVMERENEELREALDKCVAVVESAGDWRGGAELRTIRESVTK